jgi:hypothetical protein
MIKCSVNYLCGSDMLMGWLSLFLVASTSIRGRIFVSARFIAGSRFKCFDLTDVGWLRLLSGLRVPHVEDHWYEAYTRVSLLFSSEGRQKISTHLSWVLSFYTRAQTAFKILSRYYFYFQAPDPSTSTRYEYQKQKMIFLRSRVRPVRKPDNLTSVCEPIV